MGKVYQSFTDEEIKFIESNYDKMTYPELTKNLNNKFNVSKTVKSVSSKVNRLGLKKQKTEYTKFTKEQLDFIRDNYKQVGHSNKFAQLFNERFNTKRTSAQLRSRATSLGVNQGKHFSEEQLNWLEENSSKYYRDELTKQFNKKFGENRSVECISSTCTRKNRQWLAKPKDRRTYLPQARYDHEIYLDNRKLPRIRLTDEEAKQVGEEHKYAYLSQYIYCKNTGHFPNKDEKLVYLDGNNKNCEFSNLLLTDIRVNARFRLYGWNDIDNIRLKKLAVQQCEFEQIIIDVKKGNNE